MLKVCLDDQETVQLLFCAADEFARGDVPRGVGHCFTLATLTALQKKDGGVRGVGRQDFGEAIQQAGRSSVSGPFTPSLPDTCGKTKRGTSMKFANTKGGANMGTLSCPSFSLAIHNALNEAKQEMLDGEELFAFLDDVYIVSSPERTRHLYNLVAEKLLFVAGLQLHTEKTRCWNQNGRCPPDMVDLGPEVWSSFEFIKEVGDRRLEEEQRLWDAIPWIPDLQCAWQVFLQGAGPRCHHFLRTMPPSCSVCPWPRHRHATHDGRGVGRTPWERGTSHGGEDVGDVAHENGRVGLPICQKDGTLCVLGVLGGCFANDRRSVAPGCRSRRRSSDQ